MSTPDSSPAPVAPLAAKERYGFAVGDFGMNLIMQTQGAFLMIFYTDIYGIGAGAVATMFFVARMWDAINDPVMGLLADRTKTRMGKFRPWILGLALPFGAFSFLVFLTPPGFDEGAKLYWAYFTYITLMMILTGVGIPYGSLMAVMSPDPHERTRISANRFVITSFASIVVQGGTLKLVEWIGDGNDQYGYAYVVGVYAGVATMLLLYTVLSTKERVDPPPKQSQNPKEDFKVLARNWPFWAMTITGIMVVVTTMIRGTVWAYYINYFVEEDLTFFRWTLSGDDRWAFLMVWGTSCYIFGMTQVQRIVRIFGDKRRAFAAMALVNALACVPFGFLRPDEAELILLWGGLQGFSVAPLFPISAAMMTDVADFTEWKFKRRCTGLIMSASSFAMKFGGTFAGSVLGWSLAYYGFVANAPQTADVYNVVLLMSSWFPALCGTLTVLAVLFYPLTEEKVMEIIDDLRSQREEQGNVPTA